MSNRQWLVTGSRDWEDWPRFCEVLDWVWAEHGHPSKIIHGGAWGADAMASRWAYSRRADLDILGAQWFTHKKAAGPIRNIAMLAKAEPGDIVIGFPLVGSRGTAHMLNISRERGDLIVYEVGA